MKQFRKVIPFLLATGCVAIVLLHITGLRLGSNYYYCRLITWRASTDGWPGPFYHGVLDGPTGSFKSYSVYGMRIDRWSWHLVIRHN